MNILVPEVDVMKGSWPTNSLPSSLSFLLLSPLFAIGKVKHISYSAFMFEYRYTFLYICHRNWLYLHIHHAFPPGKACEEAVLGPEEGKLVFSNNFDSAADVMVDSEGRERR